MITDTEDISGDDVAASRSSLQRFRRWTTDVRSAPPGGLRPLVTPVALVAVYGFVQWLYLRPVSPSDQMHYFEVAEQFPDASPNHRSIRYGLVLPVRVFQELFGFSEAAYYAVPFLAGALLIVATFLIGRRLFDTSVGLGASLVLLVSHLFLDDSSHLLPDGLAAALFTAGLALLLAALERERRVEHDEDAVTAGSYHRVLFVTAGLLFGWAYLAREYIPFLFPVVPFAFWSYRVPWRRLLDVAVPAFTLFVVDLAMNGFLYGQPLLRLYEGGTKGGRNNPGATRWDALMRLPDTLWSSPGGRAIVVALVLFAASLLVRHRSFRILAVWFLALWVPLTLGTGLIDPAFRFIRTEKLRYWLPVAPAILIGALAVVHHTVTRVVERSRSTDSIRRWSARGAVSIVALLLAVGAFGGVRDRGVYRINGADEQWALRAWLQDAGQSIDTVWTDGRTARIMPVYSRSIFGSRVWDGTVREFVDRAGRDFVPPGTIEGGALVLYERNLGFLPGGQSGLPSYISAPQPGWRLAFERGRLAIYVRDDATDGGSTPTASVRVR